MTTTVHSTGAPSQQAPGTASTSVSPTAGTLWRRWRAPLGVALLLLVAAVIAALLGGGAAERPLDPADRSLSGAAALAELLREEGVRIERVSDVTAAARAATPGSLLVVANGSFLSHDDLRRLADLPADRLLLGSPSAVWQVLAPGVTPVAEARERSREPECELPAARAAGSVHIGGFALESPAGAIGCYPSPDGPTLVSYREGDRQITVTASGSFASNLRLDEDGNAALAMNLVGARSTVVWLVPPEDEPGLAGPQGRSLEQLLPENIWWAAGQLAVAIALAALWRGRRFGPVVTERLPVVVRAAETVEGRGRLYRARRARDRAAAALRTGTLHRIIPALGLPNDADQDAIIAAAAGRTGQDERRVAALFYGPPPADDATLVALAAELDTLERQVKDS